MPEPFAIFTETDYVFGEIVSCDHITSDYRNRPLILIAYGFTRGIEELAIVAFPEKTRFGAYAVPNTKTLKKTNKPFLTLEELLTHNNCTVRWCTQWLYENQMSNYENFIRQAAAVAVPLYEYEGRAYGFSNGI